tara:strand:- start:87 stop:848 length:762 start_codon:yes stop_codon:yes gene_type:complete
MKMKVAAGIFALAVLGGGAVALAQDSGNLLFEDADGVVHGCINATNGNLSLVLPEDANTCNRPQDEFSFNTSGPAGIDGLIGVDGADGPAGPAGPAGADGLDGISTPSAFPLYQVVSDRIQADPPAFGQTRRDVRVVDGTPLVKCGTGDRRVGDVIRTQYWRNGLTAEWQVLRSIWSPIGAQVRDHQTERQDSYHLPIGKTLEGLYDFNDASISLVSSGQRADFTYTIVCEDRTPSGFEPTPSTFTPQVVGNN